jgi:hypothetical protein
MENLPAGDPSEPDPTLDAINEVANTMGGGPSAAETELSPTQRMERYSRELLDFTTQENFPSISRAVLERNEELKSLIPKYAAMHNSSDPTERAEAKRFLTLLLDFSQAVHTGRADEFEPDTHTRFMNETLSPEEMFGGIVGILGTLQGRSADYVREEHDIPSSYPESDEPSPFSEDEEPLAALMLDTWIQLCDEAARQDKLLTPNVMMAVDDPTVRVAILESALAHDELAPGTPSEKIDLVDRVMSKLPLVLQTVIMRQREARIRFRDDIEGL